MWDEGGERLCLSHALTPQRAKDLSPWHWHKGFYWFCFQGEVVVTHHPESPNFFLQVLDYQTFHAEPQSLLSRRDDTCERLRPLKGLRPYEERAAERPSVYVERLRRYTARTVLVHLCELPSRPKVPLRSLILRSNNSAAQ